jgi:hypothetical protein
VRARAQLGAIIMDRGPIVSKLLARDPAMKHSRNRASHRVKRHKAKSYEDWVGSLCGAGARVENSESMPNAGPSREIGSRQRRAGRFSQRCEDCHINEPKEMCRDFVL